MLIQEIAANAMDLAGGELIKQRLDTDFAVLNTMNIIDTMMLELAQSRKAFRGYKADVTFAANTNTGTVVSTNFTLDVKFVRWRRLPTDKWELIDVVEDIEDLTRAENEGRQVILFQGAVSPLTYFLSWTPAEDIDAELWGKQVAAEVTNLNVAPAFPPEFSLVCAYRVADFTLNQLLIIDQKSYGAFVLAQKSSIARDAKRCEFIWQSYRWSIPDDGTMVQGNEYNILDDEFHGTDDGEDFVERVG